MSVASEGRIVTFYSYKGGTGRSMALANTAWLLASNGRRVLVVDWDLEAPGLQRYFHPFLHDPQLRSTRGVMDLIWDFTAAALSPPIRGEEDWLERASAITPYAESLNWDFPDGGTVDFVCSGRHDAAYSRRLSSFDWTSFYEERGGADFLDVVAESMRESYDWILIDSRTGLSDTAGICTLHLPDIVVNCFTLSAQSIEGAAAVARSIAGPERDRGIRILPVPMRVEDSERAKLERGRDVARATFDSFLRGMDPGERERYWGDVEIPYKPYYSYEEILAVFGDRPHQEGTLLAAYERLTAHLTEGEVSELPAQDERQRRRHLARFERQQAEIPLAIHVSHAPRDRNWADWIAGELATVGFAVTVESLDGRDGAAPKTTGDADVRTVVVLSPAYVSSPDSTDHLRADVAGGGVGAVHPPLALRVKDVELPAEFDGLDLTELVGLDEGAARRALFAAVGPPTRRSPDTPPLARSTTSARFPGAPPQIWTGVPARNPAFVGREDQLAALRERFVGTDAAPTRTLVLQGLGGVGKTQIAGEYAHRFGSSYDLVCWVGCDQPALVRSSLAALTDALHLPERPGHEPVTEVINALRRGDPYRRWLLVFDNAESPEDIAPLMPSGPGHVLVTSRNQRWQGRQARLEVGVFSRDESVALLRRRAPSLTEDMAARLAEALGDLPLALEHAGAWHAETGMSAEGYLELLERSPRPLLLEGEIPTYPRPVARTWLLSVERLREQMPVAARLAELCAFLGPEPISMEILAGDDLRDLSDPDDQALRDPLLLATAVRNVTEHALARVVDKDGSSCLEMHRLVQAVLRDDLTPQRRAQARRRAQELLAAADPGDPDGPQAWTRYAQLRPHIRAADAVHSTVRAVSELVRNVVRSLYTQRHLGDCRELASEILPVWRDNFGEDDRRTLRIALDLADSLRALGDPTTARELDEAARERLVRALGRDHDLSLRAARALGGDLRGMRQYQQARALDEQTYERFRINSWLDREDGISAANNLAVSLRFVGDFRRALELSRDIHERVRAQEPPAKKVDILQYTDSYARDLRECGRYLESLAILQKTQEECRENLGEDHADTLRSLRNFAVSLRWCGREDESRRISESTFRAFRDRFGLDHRETLATAVSLTYDLCLAGEKVAARRLAEDTLHRAQNHLGADSLDTLGAANALAVTSRRLGNAAAAATIAEQTLAKLQSSLPPGHPFIYYGAANLANCLDDLGRVHERNQLDRLVESSLQTHLGYEHPQTMISTANRATSLANAGIDGVGNTVSPEVLEELHAGLGSEHPIFAKISAGDRIDFEIDPPPP
ncbi:CobQ/CobB/MinD/ParA nucleotide binding domain-containing protein [Frankia canadensis]|uniref:CobQ/CobB/MinD/ParA nucleotide binding domain-containing protein n=1 Tax=Frankia canadensis TaxID=1836972 RepID=A0A2I2L1V7_9ACTN|nr:FxSxx-COOH system tetratricopeptide repeat protein [Frankia canadensis]SNQ51901.1 CobQ/CobB/MinD/ParA nucleotide binding domain-containing protein [Frankia canadensis]SOU59191.1 CobQ/CobB/MinD/ParA nucleotide binding domain-containing protein [Frankia canadensis]